MTGPEWHVNQCFTSQEHDVVNCWLGVRMNTAHKDREDGDRAYPGRWFEC